MWISRTQQQKSIPEVFCIFAEAFLPVKLNEATCTMDYKMMTRDLFLMEQTIYLFLCAYFVCSKKERNRKRANIYFKHNLLHIVT